jgi:hypothetical protein
MITGTWWFRTPAARDCYVPLIMLEPTPDDVEPPPSEYFEVALQAPWTPRPGPTGTRRGTVRPGLA